MPIKLDFKDDRIIVDVNFLSLSEFTDIQKHYGKDKAKLDKMFLYMYYMYSLDEANVFRDLDSRVKADQAIYRIWKKRESSPPFNKKESELFEKATDAYVLFSATEEERMIFELDRKIEQIRKTIKKTEPQIVEQLNQHGVTSFVSNMDILTKAINEIPKILETKEKLIASMKKQSFNTRNRGGRSQTSFREKGVL